MTDNARRTEFIPFNTLIITRNGLKSVLLRRHEVNCSRATVSNHTTARSRVVLQRRCEGIPGTRTDYGYLSSFDGRPAFRGRRTPPLARLRERGRG